MLRMSFRKAMLRLVRTRVKLAAERRKDITAGIVSCHAAGENRSGREKTRAKQTKRKRVGVWEGNKRYQAYG